MHQCQNEDIYSLTDLTVQIFWEQYASPFKYLSECETEPIYLDVSFVEGGKMYHFVSCTYRQCFSEVTWSKLLYCICLLLDFESSPLHFLGHIMSSISVSWVTDLCLALVDSLMRPLQHRLDSILFNVVDIQRNRKMDLLLSQLQKPFNVSVYQNEQS